MDGLKKIRSNITTNSIKILKQISLKLCMYYFIFAHNIVDTVIIDYSTHLHTQTHTHTINLSTWKDLFLH